MGQLEVDRDRSSKVTAATNLGLLIAGLTEKVDFLRVAQSKNILGKFVFTIKVTQIYKGNTAQVDTMLTMAELSEVSDVNVVIDAICSQLQRAWVKQGGKK